MVVKPGASHPQQSHLDQSLQIRRPPSLPQSRLPGLLRHSLDWLQNIKLLLPPSAQRWMWISQMTWTRNVSNLIHRSTKNITLAAEAKFAARGSIMPNVYSRSPQAPTKKIGK
jgi:hypothetical protein